MKGKSRFRILSLPHETLFGLGPLSHSFLSTVRPFRPGVDACASQTPALWHIRKSRFMYNLDEAQHEYQHAEAGSLLHALSHVTVMSVTPSRFDIVGPRRWYIRFHDLRHPSVPAHIVAPPIASLKLSDFWTLRRTPAQVSASHNAACVLNGPLTRVSTYGYPLQLHYSPVTNLENSIQDSNTLLLTLGPAFVRIESRCPIKVRLNKLQLFRDTTGPRMSGSCFADDEAVFLIRDE